MKHTHYFTDLTHTGAGINSHVFPLGVGNVAAYAKQNLSSEASVEIFKFPEDLNSSLKKKGSRLS